MAIPYPLPVKCEVCRKAMTILEIWVDAEGWIYLDVVCVVCGAGPNNPASIRFNFAALIAYAIERGKMDVTFVEGNESIN